ncbi:amyloid protein-binding protein 2-like [Ochlerotatus camptorhynchus]|uniref:amyloid protein-binding protein 2-like n=1 Tax=Ochlerotatus camptorhynchus TaxID=644619 RepID=UPI0031D0C56D
MISKMYNAINKARFSGIRIVPANAPSLYQECVKVFVAEVNRTHQNGKRISELQFLPTAALVNIFEEMCLYPALRDALRQELSDPALFMRIFNGHASNQHILDRCLREASFSGKPVLSDLATNYCDMARSDPLEPGSPAFMSRILATLKLGSYLHEAGWASFSVDVLVIAKDMISLIKDNRFHKKLELECIQKLLRSERSSSHPNAKQTCDTLLQLIVNVIDTDALVKSYMEIAHFHYSVEEYDQCHEWSLKAMSLITDSTPIGDVIAVLQIEALFCFAKQRYDLGSMLIAQAIHRARSKYGNVHPRYADVLLTYGECLLLMNAVSDAVSTFMELLDVTTKLYGQLTPTVPIVQGYLAYGFYLRSHATGRFDMAESQIEKAIAQAKQLIPSNKRVLEDLNSIRSMVLQGHDIIRAAMKENHVTKASNYQTFSFPEIRDKCVELNASFE